MSEACPFGCQVGFYRVDWIGTEAERVWSCYKTNWPCKDHPPRYCVWGKKEKQTGEETGRQHSGRDCFDLQDLLVGSSKLRGIVGALRKSSATSLLRNRIKNIEFLI